MIETYFCSASIVLYKTNPSIAQKAIDSFLHSEIPKSIFILIDHSPTNELKNSIQYQSNIHKVEYYHHPENKGYGAGHNIAIRKIQEISPIHFIINPDVYFDKNVLNDLSNILLQYDELGMIMPKIVDQNNSIQYLAKLLPRPIDVFGKRFLPNFLTKKLLDNYQLKFADYSKIMNVPYLSGCFMGIKTSVLKTVGGFDERFFMYPEDIDLTRRIHELYDTWYYPDVKIIHLHEAGSYKSFKMLWIHIYNMIKYFNKWGWFFDKKRKKMNKKVIESFNSI